MTFLENRRAVGRNASADEYGGRRRAGPPTEMEPLAERPSQPLPSPSDWTFDMIEQYHDVIRRTAQRFGLDTYPNQLEIITSEQMMDAYASVGMPVNYRHWSYGKEFISTEKKIGRASGRERVLVAV